MDEGNKLQAVLHKVIKMVCYYEFSAKIHIFAHLKK
jgi:hypothetical protein